VRSSPGRQPCRRSRPHGRPGRAHPRSASRHQACRTEPGPRGLGSTMPRALPDSPRTHPDGSSWIRRNRSSPTRRPSGSTPGEAARWIAQHRSTHCLQRLLVCRAGTMRASRIRHRKRPILTAPLVWPPCRYLARLSADKRCAPAQSPLSSAHVIWLRHTSICSTSLSLSRNSSPALASSASTWSRAPRSAARQAR